MTPIGTALQMGTFTRFASADGGLTEYLDEVGSNSGFTAVGAARDTLIATMFIGFHQAWYFGR